MSADGSGESGGMSGGSEAEKAADPGGVTRWVLVLALSPLLSDSGLVLWVWCRHSHLVATETKAMVSAEQGVVVGDWVPVYRDQGREHSEGD